jgi:hypothetical protein
MEEKEIKTRRRVGKEIVFKEGKMKKSLIGAIVLFSILISSAAFSQQLQTGTVRGTVTDDTGAPLPGVNVTVKGPRLIGSLTDISNKDGLYRISALPSGTYTISFVLEGFKTVLWKDVIVQVGMNIKVNITMEPATIEQEVTVVAPSPTVDIQSNKLATTITAETMRLMPLNRDLMSVINLTPSATGGEVFTGAKVIHGGTEVSTMFQIDGVNTTDPDVLDPGPAVEFEIMEEVEIETGGLPPQIGQTSGGFVNVVTKSGGNDFHGTVQTYYTAEGLNQVLFTDEELNAYGFSKPSFPTVSTQNSATFGGPILKDKLWFFGAGAYRLTNYVPNFIPFTVLGKEYDQYEPKDKYYSGFLKLTGMLTKNLRFFVMGNYNITKFIPVNWSPFRAYDSTQPQDQPNTTLTGNLSWVISPNTMLEIRGGWNDIKYLQYNRPDATNNPYFRDSYTGYRWGSGSRDQEVLRWTDQANILLTHFQDDFLGGNHEIKAGAEFYYGVSDWILWRDNPIIWNFYNGSPWYYRGRYGLDGPHPVYGDGQIAVQALGPKNEPNRIRADNTCLTAFFQDSWTIANRLTLNLGFRVDKWNGWVPMYKKGAETPLAVAIGAATYLPSLGFNPFGELPAPPRWDDALNWTGFSPRLGLAYDLFGDGKTALKASYSRYRQMVTTASFQQVSPYQQYQFSYNWWDLNNNGQLDAPPVDRYDPFGASPAAMLSTTYKELLDPNLNGPIIDEIIASVNHELLPDLNVGVQYIYKKVGNLVSGVLYDPNTGRQWNTYEKAPEWWIPFTTIVPAFADFPEQKVTMYFLSNNAPEMVYRLTNIPESKRKYQALELTFEKRLSHGWQLGGSIVTSKVEGNQDDTRDWNWGWNGFYDANYFVNRYGRNGHDQPLIIKLYGTAQLPLRFMASFFYTHFSGYPYQREGEVVPPEAWANENNARPWSWWVNLEPQGTRRRPAVDNIDFRLEKEFAFGSSKRLGMFVDIYNLLGNKYLYPDTNPGGTWLPAGENTNQGEFIPSGTYGRVLNLSGVRTFKFSLRFSF